MQVKGLQDVTPNDILSRQSVVSAGRFKPPDSPPSKSSKSNLVDKTTLTTFKNKRLVRSSNLSTRTSSEAALNGSLANSDSDDKEDAADNEQQSDDRQSASEAVNTRARKRRGRPPKKRPEKESRASASTSTSAKRTESGGGGGDPYEFEDESHEGGVDKLKKRKTDYDDDLFASPTIINKDKEVNFINYIVNDIVN